MHFRDNPLQDYIANAPLALALERTVEGRLYQDLDFTGPILDVGCGDGLFANMVFSDAIDVGIDPDGRELESARLTLAYRELIQCSGDRIPKPDQYFGTSFSNSVLEHITDIEPVMREVWRVLKPGGNFYFTVPSEKFFQHSNAGTVLKLLNAETTLEKYHRGYNQFWKHYHDYSVAEWSELGVRYGFESIETFTYNPAVNCRINDALVPLGAVSKINKSLRNQWVLSPKVRRKLLNPLLGSLNRLIADAGTSSDGGLVFCWFRKPAS